MAEYTVTNTNFEDEVMHTEKTVLIDFWASWCGPCRMLAPVVAEIAEEHPEVKVCKVNVDEEPDLAGKFQVFSIPTLVVMKNGKVITTSVGVRPKKQIVDML